MPVPNNSLLNKETAVIIPAYNPSAALLQICSELLQLQLSVFVVNDGSGNRAVFNALEQLPVTIIHHPINMGQGAALETGIARALQMNKQFFVTFDADGQHAAASVADLLGVLLKEQADIVFGSRFIKKELSVTVPAIKRLTLKAAAVFDGLLTGIWLSDSHNGLRAFTRKAAAGIHFTENRMAHATEILWLAKKNRWKYAECGVMVQYGQPSQHPAKSIEIAIDLFLRKIIS